MTNKNLFSLFTVIFVFATTLNVSAQKGKNDDEDNGKGKIEAKIWFKDGRVYEGLMPKHWLTYKQTFLNPGHSFHIVSPDDPSKTVKCEAADVDSILITASTHDDFAAGDFFLSVAGISFKKGKYKMIRRVYDGRNIDFCKMPYIGNCKAGIMNLDQRIEMWWLRMKTDGELYMFYSNPIEAGCHKPEFYAKDIAEDFKEINPALSEAIMERFYPKDKKARKELAKEVLDNPQIFVGFVDDFLTKHPSK